jgi:hypothetical protein
VKNRLLLNSKIPDDTYKSILYPQLVSGSKYHGEKYLVRANKNEIGIYNLFTNNLIASFVTSFSITEKEVPQKDGYFEFSVNADSFDEEF